MGVTRKEYKEFFFTLKFIYLGGTRRVRQTEGKELLLAGSHFQMPAMTRDGSG